MSRKANRREFLKTGLITTAAAMTAGPAIILNPDSIWAQTYPDLVVSHGSDPGAITRRAVEALGGMKRFVKPGNKVVIKPNMSFASGPASASNTHPGSCERSGKNVRRSRRLQDLHFGQCLESSAGLHESVQDTGSL